MIAGSQLMRPVTVEEWAGPAVCSLPSATGRQPVSLAALPCSGDPNAVLSCDFAAAEPLDLPLGQLCAANAVPVSRAKPVRFELDSARNVRVEWLDSTDSRPVAVMASRDVAVDRDVLVARRESRYLRVFRGDASPVTILAAALPADRPWRVAELPGGEVLLHVAQAAVRPMGYRLSGTATREGLLAQEGLTALSGLAPGPYDVTLLYAGGGAATPIRVQVERGESSVVSHGVQPLGAISISTSPETCARTTAVGVGGPRGFRSFPHEGRCDRLVSGLLPGDYHVELFTKGGPVIARPATVKAQEVTPLHVVAETASASGRVIMNGAPADGLIVDLRRRGTSPAVLAVRGGVYGGDVGEPGEYKAVLRDARQRDISTPAAERTVTLVAGDNAIDWEVAGATLLVKLPDWSRTSPVNLYLTNARGGEDIRLETTDDREIRITGLPFGKFSISATESSRPRKRTSARVTGNLTKDKPEAEVTLTLSESRVTLVVRDAAGLPFRTREIRGEEIGDGVYAMDTQPGDAIRLRVRGYGPVCKIARTESPIEVTMLPARPLEVQSRGIRAIPSWSMILPGSECPIPFVFLLPRVVPAHAADSMGMLLFDDFPSGESISVVFGSGPASPSRCASLGSAHPASARALSAQSITDQLVPGVTSRSAAPTCAGVPITASRSPD